LIKEILDYLYLISGPILAIVSILALKQLSIAKTQLEIAKNSIEISSQRDAAVFTAKQCEYFATEIIKDSVRITAIFESKDIVECSLANDSTNIFETDYNSWLTKNRKKFLEDDSNIYREITEAINKLEAFAVYFIHGICDTKIAYLPVAEAYITIVKMYCPFICMVRSRSRNGYSDIIELYKIWENELKKDELNFKKVQLQKQITETEEQVSSVKDISKKPIGTVYKNYKKDNK
jgi:hypothetical protein